jgi:hypothetical protein
MVFGLLSNIPQYTADFSWIETETNMVPSSEQNTKDSKIAGHSKETNNE